MFAEWVNRGENPSAIALFQRELLGFETEVSKPLRAVYHLLRWMETRDPAESRALQSLAGSSRVIDEALKVVQRLVREASVADALKHREPSRCSVPQVKTLTPQGAAIEHLALACLELNQPLHRERPLLAAKAVYALLGASKQTDETLKDVHNRLRLWACWNLKKFDEIFSDPALAKLLRQTDENAWISAICAAGVDQIENDRIDAALGLFTAFRTDLSDETAQRLAVQWGLAALRGKRSSTALAWFDHPVIRKMLGGHPLFLPIAMAVASFQAGKYSEGRKFLEAVSKSPDADARKTWILFLEALSHFAAVGTAPQENDSKSQEANPQNRSLWSLAAKDIFRLANELSGLDKTKSLFIQGLAVYIDRNATLSVEQIQSFHEAVEQLGEDPQKRAGLIAIEGALLTRSKAAEEAIGYIQRGDWPGLRALFEEVLIPLGDAVPAQVRAAVCLSLAVHAQDFDPLPELRRIPRTTATESLLNQAVQQAETLLTLRSLNRSCKTGQEAPLTPPSVLTLDRQTEIIVRLAQAACSLSKKLWREALDALPQLSAKDDPEIAALCDYARFYAAWQAGQIDVCLTVGDNRHFKNDPDRQPALEVRYAVHLLETGEGAKAVEQVLKCAPKLRQREKKEPVPVLIAVLFCLWLLHRKQALQASSFINAFEKTYPKTSEGQRWVLDFLRGLAAALAQQYATCLDLFGSLAQRPSAAASPATLEITNLLRLQAELAMLSATGAELKHRLPSSCRSLSAQAGALQDQAALKPYAFLVEGLVAYLSTDDLVQDETVMRLDVARRNLEFSKSESFAFLDQVLSQLNWRRQIIAHFWNNLQRGDFKEARNVFSQIEPVFGDKLPASIRLGMILVDWDGGKFSTPELLKRLVGIENEALELNPEVIQKVKDYILEGNRIREVTDLFKKSDFESVIRFVENTPEWSSAMPTPVAIAILYSMYKKKRSEDALRFSDPIKNNPRLADWVRDYGNFILGYLCFDKGDYAEAATAFEKIGVPTLFGHSTDRYWAVSHYRHGLLLLDASDKRSTPQEQKKQKQEAFEAFRRSLSQRGGAHDNVSLAPLFLHFGMENLEQNSGNRALLAFSQLAESLEGTPGKAPRAEFVKLLARMGQILSGDLLDGAKPDPTGAPYMKIAGELREIGNKAEIPEHIRFERVLRILTISQTLKSQAKKATMKAVPLGAFLSEQLDALDWIDQQAAPSGEDEPKNPAVTDPFSLLIRGLIALRLSAKPDLEAALEMLSRVARLGVHSPHLVALIQNIRESQSKLAENKLKLLDVVDAYLITGTLPSPFRQSILDDDDIAELYRINRAYTPPEIPEHRAKNTIAVMKARLQHLSEMAKENGVTAVKSVDKLHKVHEELEAQEKNFLELEKDVLAVISKSICGQAAPPKE